MDIGMGDLTFLTDGTDYICIWSPTGEDWNGENARPLAIISTALMKDQEDFKRWQEDIKSRWLDACARILDAPREDMHVEQIATRATN